MLSQYAYQQEFEYNELMENMFSLNMFKSKYLKTQKIFGPLGLLKEISHEVYMERKQYRYDQLYIPLANQFLKFLERRENPTLFEIFTFEKSLSEEPLRVNQMHFKFCRAIYQQLHRKFHIMQVSKMQKEKLDQLSKYWAIDFC